MSTWTVWLDGRDPITVEAAGLWRCLDESGGVEYRLLQTADDFDDAVMVIPNGRLIAAVDSAAIPDAPGLPSRHDIGGTWTFRPDADGQTF